MLQDKHLKYKVDLRKEFELRIAITDNQLKALEWLLVNYCGDLPDINSVEDLILNGIKEVELHYDKEK